MPAFTFTANATTNEITIVGHGLVTGDGPATPRNVGGALPGGLAALTDYWLIRIDNDTLKIATSSSNAMAGTAIDLTTSGSGTNILEIGIPYRRPRTYAAGSQVKSVDLNGNFDAWKALYALLTGQAQSVWDGISLAANQHVTVSGTGRFRHGTLELDVPMEISGRYTSGEPGVPGDPPIASSISGVGSTSGFVAYFTLPVGKRIVNVNAVVQESTSGGTDRAHISLMHASNVSTWTLVGTSSPSAGDGTLQTITLPSNHDVLTAKTYAVVVNFALGSAAINVNRIFVEYDG